SALDQRGRVGFAGIFAPGKEHDVEALQRRAGSLAHVEYPAAKANRAAALARRKRRQMRNGNVALFEHAHDRLADGARRSDDCDIEAHRCVISSTSSRPTTSPRACITARIEANMPG